MVVSRKMRVSLLSVVLSFFSASTLSSAADVIKLALNEQTADFSADCETYPDPCICNFVALTVTNGPSAESSISNHPAATLLISIRSFDQCTGKAVFDGYKVADLSEGEFSFSKKLSRASVRTSVPVWDRISKRLVPLSVAVNWEASGSVVQGDGVLREFTPVHKRSGQYKGDSRTARISGSIRDGSRNYLNQTIQVGRLYTIRKGELSLTRRGGRSK